MQCDSTAGAEGTAGRWQQFPQTFRGMDASVLPQKTLAGGVEQDTQTDRGRLGITVQAQVHGNNNIRYQAGANTSELPENPAPCTGHYHKEEESMEQQKAEELTQDLIDAAIRHERGRYTLGDQDRFAERERIRYKIIVTMTAEDKPAPKSVVLAREELADALHDVDCECGEECVNAKQVILDSHKRLRKLLATMVRAYDGASYAIVADVMNEIREVAREAP